LKGHSGAVMELHYNTDGRWVFCIIEWQLLSNEFFLASLSPFVLEFPLPGNHAVKNCYMAECGHKFSHSRLKSSKKKRVGRVTQGAGPEFKPQYCQKKKNCTFWPDVVGSTGL
jgi:hypothetical protein